MVEFNHVKKTKKGKRAYSNLPIDPYPFPDVAPTKKARAEEMKEEWVELVTEDGTVQQVPIRMPTTLDNILDGFKEPMMMPTVLLPRMLTSSKFPINIKGNGSLYYGKRRGRPNTNKLVKALGESLRDNIDWDMDLENATNAELKEVVRTGKGIVRKYNSDMTKLMQD